MYSFYGITGAEYRHQMCVKSFLHGPADLAKAFADGKSMRPGGKKGYTCGAIHSMIRTHTWEFLLWNRVILGKRN